MKTYYSNAELPNEDYHADRDHISKSWLDDIAKCPAWFRYRRDNPQAQKETEALKLGSAIHHYILEHDTFNEYYIDASPIDGIDRRTKAGKAAHADFLELADGKIPILSKEQAILDGCYRSLQAHPKARNLLKNGLREHSVFWQDEDYGVMCKARADYLRDDISMIVDLKTTIDASPDGFSKSVANYRYDVQDAHYRKGFDAEHFVFIAIEKEPPYLAAVYYLDDLAVQRGERLRNRNIETYLECAESGIWPGYSDKIVELELPAWSFRNI